MIPLRSLQMMLSLSLDNITTFQEYYRVFKQIIKEYNNRFQDSIHSSPKAFLKKYFMKGIIECSTSFLQIFILDNAYITYLKNFNYEESKKKITKLVHQMKAKYPFNTTVRIHQNKEKLLKKSHQTSWSDQNYLVFGFKRPLKTSEDVGIYLTDLNGERISGVFYDKQLKVIPVQKYKKIHKIITFLKKKRAIRSKNIYLKTHFQMFFVSE